MLLGVVSRIVAGRKPFGYPASTRLILVAMAIRGPSTIADVCEAAGVGEATAWRSIAELEADGLVRRHVGSRGGKRGREPSTVEIVAHKLARAARASLGDPGRLGCHRSSREKVD